MNKDELPDVESVELRLRLDATLTVNKGTSTATEWLKPGVEGSMRWNGIPTQEQIQMGYQFINQGMLAPTLEDVIVHLRAVMVEARRNG